MLQRTTNKEANAWVVKTQRNSRKLFRDFGIFFCSRDDKFLEEFQLQQKDKNILYIATGDFVDENNVKINLVGEIKDYGLIEDKMNDNDEIAQKVKQAFHAFIENTLDRFENTDHAKSIGRSTKNYFYAENIQYIPNCTVEVSVYSYSNFVVVPISSLLHLSDEEEVSFDHNQSILKFKNQHYPIKYKSKQWLLCKHIYLDCKYTIGEGCPCDEIAEIFFGNMNKFEPKHDRSVYDAMKGINDIVGVPIFEWKNKEVIRLF